MPPKKAAKKSAKDHNGKHHQPKHHHEKDLRRAYEHLGRVEILRRVLGGHAGDMATLVDLSQREIADGDSKNAADLLRAAEHLGFAAILDKLPGGAAVSGGLLSAIEEEFEKLEAKAQEHWNSGSTNPAIAQICQDTLKKASLARQKGVYRQALEMVRGAEALAHVKIGHKKHLPRKVAASSNVRELAAS